MGKDHIMMARVPEGLYNALKSGEAMQKNGLRSNKGYFWSEQPELFEMPKNTVNTAKVVSNVASMAGGLSGKSLIGMGVVAVAAGAVVKHAINNSQENYYAEQAEQARLAEQEQQEAALEHQKELLREQERIEKRKLKREKKAEKDLIRYEEKVEKNRLKREQKAEQERLKLAARYSQTQSSQQQEMLRQQQIILEQQERIKRMEYEMFNSSQNINSSTPANNLNALQNDKSSNINYPPDRQVIQQTSNWSIHDSTRQDNHDTYESKNKNSFIYKRLSKPLKLGQFDRNNTELKTDSNLNTTDNNRNLEITPNELSVGVERAINFYCQNLDDYDAKKQLVNIVLLVSQLAKEINSLSSRCAAENNNMNSEDYYIWKYTINKIISSRVCIYINEILKTSPDIVTAGQDKELREFISYGQ